MMYARPIRRWTCLALTMMAGGCAPALTHGLASSDRAQYERELERTRGGSALARAWAAEGNAALRTPRRSSIPLDDAVNFTAGTPGAAAYRVTLRRADRLNVVVQPPHARARGSILELFEVVPGTTERLLLVARSERGGDALRTIIPRDGEYVLLVQPRLEHGGRFRVVMATGAEAPLVASAATALAALHFPVDGRGMNAIGSVFGDPRDGGRRAHHGVDIFAPRGTPVLAAADGRITNVALTPVGGRVIWQVADDSGLELYYAHLDQQHVRQGQRVRAGQRIGTVGNTGNARTTPPHLHFGVYAGNRQPLDPSPMLAAGTLPQRPVARAAPPAAPASAASAPPPPPPPVVGEGEAAPADNGAAGNGSREIALAGVGTWMRTTGGGTVLRDAGSPTAREVASLAAGTPVRLLGGTTSWYRVALPGGASGFVPAAGVGRLGEALSRRAITVRTPLLESAAADAATLETIFGGESVEILAEYAGHQLVRTVTGRVGWIRG